MKHDIRLWKIRAIPFLGFGVDPVKLLYAPGDLAYSQILQYNIVSLIQRFEPVQQLDEMCSEARPYPVRYCCSGDVLG